MSEVHNGLRGYQRAMIEDASALFKSNIKRVEIQAPTGSGKTVLAAHMLQRAASKGFRSYFICHRRELVKQASQIFTEAGVEHGVIASGFRPNADRVVQIGGIQTLARYRDKLAVPRFVIWDECHHLPAPGWAALQDQFSNAFHIGLSATPIRLDGKGLGDHFDRMVVGPSIAWLQRRGFLAKCVHYAPSSLDITGVRVQRGDFVRGELAAAVGRSSINADAVRSYQRLARGRRAIIFAASIDGSQAAVAALQKAGIAAEHVDGTTSPQDRDAAIGRFERGETLVLSNVDLFGEGFDLPALECVIMLRATWSLGLYLQMIGRSLRPAPSKQHAIVIDLVGNFRRHGLVEEDRTWSLTPAPFAIGLIRDNFSVCDACSAVSPKRPFCFACGAPPKPRRAADIDTWLNLISERGLAEKLREMSYGSAARWADDEQKILMVAMARSLKKGWTWHRLREIAGERGSNSDTQSEHQPRNFA